MEKNTQKTNYEIGKRLSIRVTDEEKQLIHAYAKRDGLTVSDYIKSIALQKVIIEKRVEYNKDLRDLNFEISKIGTNINQLAKHVNKAEKLKTIDAGSINVFNIFMKEYFELLHQATSTLKSMYKRLSSLK